MSINVADKYNLDMSGATDNAIKLAQVAADMSALHVTQKPLPRLIFPEGICAFTAWPNLAYSNLQIVAEGECHLKHIGTGDAVVFDGHAMYGGSQGGPENFLFDGFIVDPNPNTANAVVFNSIHRSHVRVNVTRGCTQAGVLIVFGILTTYDLNVSGSHIGLMLDCLPGHPELPPTANRFVGPILESCGTGCFIKYGGWNNFYDGTIEGCDTGIEIDNGGNNHFFGVEMETNPTIDLVTTGSAHDNVFMYLGHGDPGQFKTNLKGWNNQLCNGMLTGLFGL